METQMNLPQIEITDLVTQHYTVDYTKFKAHDRISTPWNSMTTLRRCTLKPTYAAMFNNGF